MANGLKLKDLLALLEGISSRNLAEDWDNVGLMVGDPEAEVTGIMVALDPTEAVLSEADREGCNTIVTHHPLIFKPLKELRLDEPGARIICQAVRTEKAVVSCHTNLDKISGGVSDMLATGLGLGPTKPLLPDSLDREGAPCGFGRIGDLPAPLGFPGFVDLVKSRLGVSVLTVAGPHPDKIMTVAVCGGSGSELAPLAQEAGAQIYLTGEIKHSMARWAENVGFCLVDAGHFATENPMVEGLARILRLRLADHGSSVVVSTTKKQGSPFQNY
jgi:dinuclear metal center YbgI/SA1388 family protein